MSTAIASITGKVATEPKIVHTTTRNGNSMAIVEFRLADKVYDPKAKENRSKTSKEDYDKYRTVWYNCKVLGSRGETWVENRIIEKYAVVSVAGKLSDRFWSTRDGEEVRELVLEVAECERIMSADESKLVQEDRKARYNDRSYANQRDDNPANERQDGVPVNKQVPVNKPDPQSQPATITNDQGEEDINW